MYDTESFAPVKTSFPDPSAAPMTVHVAVTESPVAANDFPFHVPAMAAAVRPAGAAAAESIAGASSFGAHAVRTVLVIASVASR